MTVARSEIVDVSVTPWYHLISKTVRGAFLLRQDEKEDFDRKLWIEDRLQLLAGCFAIDVGTYTVLDNHLHVLVCLDPEFTKSWSPEEVIRRWLTVYPPRGTNRKPVEVTEEMVQTQARNAKLVKKLRRRLSNLGWFMKSLKEPLARLANRMDGTTGTFWQSRYRSIAVLDTQALLATSAYIDLNPLAAGLVQLPEDSQYTSIRSRIEHCRQQGRLGDLFAAALPSVAESATETGIEDGLWLCPIEDRRHESKDHRRGMLDGFSLGSYLQLIDWSSRVFREGKATVSPNVASLLERLQTTSDTWKSVLRNLLTKEKCQGVAFAFDRERLAAMATHRKRKRVVNFAGCLS